MRNKFDEQLKLLNEELNEMGALCESAIANSAKALLTGDKSLAEHAISIDSEIDQQEREIESLCLKLLLQQQPVARDLRQISSALKMITVWSGSVIRLPDHCRNHQPGKLESFK